MDPFVIAPLSSLHSCSIKVSGVFCAIDGKQQKLQVSQLKTPMFQYAESLLRMQDIVSIRIIPGEWIISQTWIPKSKLMTLRGCKIVWKNLVL